MIQFGEVIHRCAERRTGNHEPYIPYSACVDFPVSVLSIERKENDDQNCKTLHAKKGTACN